MESIKNIYRIGNGPSSSHTIGPKRAATQFLQKNSDADSFIVTLYGSLAATGKGHFTDKVINDALSPQGEVTIIWEPKIVLPFHTNGMKFESFINGHKSDEWIIYSIGGGSLANETTQPEKKIYSHESMSQITEWCERYGKSYWEYVFEHEDEDLSDYLALVWKTMREAIDRGLEQEGVLPGGLGLRRKALEFNTKARSYNESLKSRGLIYSYALAASEENATCGVVVTAPTCGSCGVLSGVLYHLSKSKSFPDSRIIRALATAGLFGNIVKRNASISGATVGCQGEVGVACAMAAAACCQLFGGTIAQIEYAAEMGLEHHLGMTCDPVCGLVQVPCIERNAYAAARALDVNLYSMFTDGKHIVSFDHVVEVMMQTGTDIPSVYKETSEGGLAKMYNSKDNPKQCQG